MTETEKLESCMVRLRKDMYSGYHGECMSAEDRKMVLSALEELQRYRGNRHGRGMPGGKGKADTKEAT